MRILQHCVYYPPEVGGLESHVAALSEGLVALGHEVRVITSQSQPGLPVQEKRNGVEIYRTWFPARNPAGWMLHAIGSVPATRKGAQWADVVHAQAFASVLPCHLAVLGPGAGKGTPLVATFHTSHFLVRAKKLHWRPVLGQLVAWPDHALAASKEIAQVAQGLAPGQRVEALTNGVETEVFKQVTPSHTPPNGVRYAIVPRRLFPKNGVEFALRALPLVRTKIPNLEFLFVGDGPERQRLEQLARELGVAESAHFLGSQPHSEMPALLSSAEVAIFPSLMEATSVAALECMSCGLPVVATNVGGLPEIVDDQVGGLVPAKDPGALAHKIAEVLGRSDLANLGVQARARVIASWSNARLVSRHVEIYTDCIERGRHHGRTSQP